tara:strand:+ start:318 stop:536 length:219 start_codon:yes stop_codon:yes gene_type:complete
MNKVQQAWLSMRQAAEYIGISRRSLDKAVTLKEKNICNEMLHIKYVGNEKRLSRESLDEIETIVTDINKLRK